jgi:hypothetical protein
MPTQWRNSFLEVMKFYWLVLAILSVWRITHLLQTEDGPWDVIVRLRRSVGNGFLGTLMDCFYCLSLWISVPFSYALAENWSEGTMLWLSLSAGAIILQRLTHEEK